MSDSTAEGSPAVDSSAGNDGAGNDGAGNDGAVDSGAEEGKRQQSHIPDPLSDLLRYSLEPGYVDAAKRRAQRGPRTGWKAITARGGHIITLVVVGFLLSVAYQKVVAEEPRASRARADLVSEVRQRKTDTESLQRRANSLRAEVARKGESALDSDTEVEPIRLQAARAGFGKVTGEGIVVELTDAATPIDPVTGRTMEENPGVILDRDLQDVVNSLWMQGVEAVAINDQRLTSLTTIRSAGGVILVDFQPVTSPYKVMAIGPSNLAKKFSSSPTAHRFRQYVKSYRMHFSIHTRSRIVLSSAPESRLRYARAQPSVSVDVSLTPSQSPSANKNSPIANSPIATSSMPGSPMPGSSLSVHPELGGGS